MTHRVVLVDDVPEIRQILRLILEHAGPFEVVGEASNGTDAIALAADLLPDLLVMDVEMRGGPSGWEVLPKIREAAPQTAVVILSGSASDPMQRERESMADGVLEKGLAPQELEDALLAILGNTARVSCSPSSEPSPPAAPGGDTDVERLQLEREQAGRELEGFAAVASHDLAQPLQVAYGYLEMVRSEFAEGMDETAIAWIDAAVTSLERMRLLVQDILSFARSGTREVPPEAVSIEDAARAAIVAIASFVEERGAHVTLRPPLPVVHAQDGCLTQVLECLLDNAVRFVPDGTTPMIEVSAEEGPTEWIVTVTDNGPGIPPDKAERVFDHFYRGPTSTNSGTGLGLSTARKVVGRMGGRIWVEGRPEGATGAWIRFALPKEST